MDDALSRKVHEMHVAYLSTCQPNLRQQIINHIVKDQVYLQIKDKLQQQNLERKYKEYQLEGDEILIIIEFLFLMCRLEEDCYT